MAATRDTATNTTVLIQVDAHLQAAPTGEKLPQAFAYAFSGSRSLIAQTAVDEKGSAALPIPPGQNPQKVRAVR